MACTKMLGAYCIAGVEETDYSWVRPIRRVGYPLYHRDISMNGKRMEMYDCAEFEIEKKLNNKPHSEDYKILPGAYPNYIKTIKIDKIKEICLQIDESKNIGKNIKDFLIDNDKSLTIIKPDKCLSINLHDPFDDAYKPSIQFIINGEYYSYKCTDIKWRNLGQVKGGAEKMREILRDKEIFFSIGLSRIFRDDYWPFIIGVHSFPDYDLSV